MNQRRQSLSFKNTIQQAKEKKGHYILSKLEQPMQVNGSEVLEMVMESRFGQMERDMKVFHNLFT